MGQQLLYESVVEGMEIGPLVKHPTTQQLVKWAGASGDYTPIHYDKEIAQSLGLPGVIVHGWLAFSFMAQLITDWIGDDGTIKKIGCSYRGLNFPREDLICRGKVTRKYIRDDEHYVDCEIWAENAKAEKTVPGYATVIIPSKG